MKAEFLLFISFSAVGAARSVFHPVIMDINLSGEKTFVFNTTIVEKRPPQTQVPQKRPYNIVQSYKRITDPPHPLAHSSQC